MCKELFSRIINNKSSLAIPWVWNRESYFCMSISLWTVAKNIFVNTHFNSITINGYRTHIVCLLLIRKIIFCTTKEFRSVIMSVLCSPSVTINKLKQHAVVQKLIEQFYRPMQGHTLHIFLWWLIQSWVSSTWKSWHFVIVLRKCESIDR